MSKKPVYVPTAERYVTIFFLNQHVIRLVQKPDQNHSITFLYTTINLYVTDCELFVWLKVYAME